MSMVMVTNISNGPRGFHAADGTIVTLEAGESWSGELARGDLAAEWFEVDGDDAEPGPLDGSVDELTAHLAGVDDADEVQRLIDAETVGKSRKGAIAALEARRDELLA